MGATIRVHLVIDMRRMCILIPGLLSLDMVCYVTKYGMDLDLMLRYILPMGKSEAEWM